MLHIYTDGACRGNPGPGSWGFIVVRNDAIIHHGADKSSNITTNNRMELLAVINALKYCKIDMVDDVTIHSDSMYIINGITKWMESWRVKDFVGVKNSELWIELDYLNHCVKPTWKWVKAHSTNKYNNQVDQLCNTILDRE